MLKANISVTYLALDARYWQNAMIPRYLQNRMVQCETYNGGNWYGRALGEYADSGMTNIGVILERLEYNRHDQRHCIITG